MCFCYCEIIDKLLDRMDRFYDLFCKNNLTFEKFCGLVFGFIGLEIVVVIMFLRCENEGDFG